MPNESRFALRLALLCAAKWPRRQHRRDLRACPRRGTGARWLLRRRRRRLRPYGGGRSPPWGHELALLLGLSLAALLPFGRFIVDRRSTSTRDLSLTHCSRSA